LQALVHEPHPGRGEPRFAGAVVAGTEGAPVGGVVPAGEQALTEDLLDEHPNLVAAGEGEDVGLARPAGGAEQVVPDAEHVRSQPIEQVQEPACPPAAPRVGLVGPLRREGVRSPHPDRPDQGPLDQVIHHAAGSAQVEVVGAEVAAVEGVHVEICRA
jgi:hypothetical protein